MPFLCIATKPLDTGYWFMLGARMPTKSEKQIRLFRNPWLERLTVVSLRTFVVIWLLLIPAILWTARGTATAGTVTVLLLAGLLAWSLTEYGLHRFFFHWQPRWAPMARLMFMIHGNHHADPTDPLRNLMPPIVSVPLGATVWGACLVFVGPAGTWLFAGWIIGYVLYDVIHFGCHQWPIHNRISGVFKVNHIRHHYAGTNGNFAITGMVWDRLFRSRISLSKI